MNGKYIGRNEYEPWNICAHDKSITIVIYKTNIIVLC